MMTKSVAKFQTSPENSPQGRQKGNSNRMDRIYRIRKTQNLEV
jgi:hypothetical protein